MSYFLNRMAVFLATVPIALALMVSSCKTGEHSEHSPAELKDSTAIQSMTRHGENFEITCLDGSTQAILITEFPNKDPREICPGVGYSECGQRILYANGRELKSANGTYFYPNGSIAIAPDGKVRYQSGQLLSDASNNLFFWKWRHVIWPKCNLAVPRGKYVTNREWCYFLPR